MFFYFFISLSWDFDLEISHLRKKFSFLPQKCKLELCMSNSSKVLIYLSLLYFIFYCTLVCNAKGNIAKSNKSELVGNTELPYLCEVRSQTFWNNCKISRSQLQNQYRSSFDLHDLKRPK